MLACREQPTNFSEIIVKTDRLTHDIALQDETDRQHMECTVYV